MNDEQKAFWSERQKTYGHTGWWDPAIYAYDQLERLAIVKKKIEGFSLTSWRALDFGCGTGDFARMLHDLGAEVVAYDPYIAPQNGSDDVRYVNDFEAVRSMASLFDIVLCVTVLDHIVDEAEFIEILHVLKGVGTASAHYLFLEYATDEAVESPKAYQAMRSLPTWRDCLSKAGLAMVEAMPLPHPLEAPSPGYLAYMQAVENEQVSEPDLKAQACRFLDKFGIGSVDQSPFKLLHCLSQAAGE